MSRPLRIEYPYAFYHIVSRGHRKENIFKSNSDKDEFLKKLKNVIFRYSIKLHAYVLMDNHYHLLLETPSGNLSLFMHNLNTSYSNWFKTKYQIIGSIFQGRYKSILIDKDAYLLSLSYYIHLNPVRAGLVEKPEDFKYSSCAAYCTGKFDQGLVEGKTILDYFSGEPALYKNHLYEWFKLNNKLEKREIYGSHGILGGETFHDQVYQEEQKSGKARDKREIPELEKLENAIFQVKSEEVKKVILDLFNIEEDKLLSKKKNNVARYLYMYGLKNFTDMRLKEIGDIFGLDYSTISANISRFLKNNNKEIFEYITKVDTRIKEIANAKT
jgi:putative transposase